MNARLQSRIDLFAVLYLVFPLAVFLGDAFRLVPAAALVALIVIGASPLVRATLKRPNQASLDCKTVLVIALVAVLWSLLAGAGHVFFANGDWFKHDGVLQDLQRYPWPVTYGKTPAGHDLILRYYIGFHVVPAFLAKLFGGLNAWVFIWETTGTFLVLMMIARRVSTRTRRALVVLIFVFYGGLDVLGYLSLHGPSHLTFTQFIDGWTLAQYNSDSTLLAWVPNHALAAWLALMLFKDRSGDKLFMIGAPMLLVAVAFWSVFAAVGLLPFVAWPLIREVWKSRGIFVIKPPVLAALVVAGVSAAFLLAGAAAGNRHGFIWTLYPHGDAVWKVSLLIVFDVLPIALAFLIARIRFETWTVVAIVVLCLLPYCVIGAASSDLTMRAAIPSQLVLFLQVAAVIEGTRPRGQHTRAPRLGRWRFVPLALVLIVGSAAGFTTLARALHPPRLVGLGTNSPSALLSVVGYVGGPPDSQYLATAPPWLSKALRHHAPAFRYVDVVDAHSSWQVQPDRDIPSATDVGDAGGSSDVQPNHGGPKTSITSISTGIDARLSGPGSVTIVTKASLAPGVYRVRASLTEVGSSLPAFAALRFGGNQVYLPKPPSGSGNHWSGDDYISVIGPESLPLSFQIVGAPASGADVQLSDLSVDLVARR